MNISIYDNNGIEVNQVSIPASMSSEYIPNGRILQDKDNGVCYKGAGTKYFGHFLLQPGEHPVVMKSPIAYLGSLVEKECYVGKTGIFLERFQPCFTDPIGGCGEKESRIVYNSQNFNKTGVAVLDAFPILPGSLNLIYKLRYTGGKEPFTGENKACFALFDLVEEMVANNWNFPWDKGCLSDVNHIGLVTDVADLFESGSIVHQFGTVYAVLYHCFQQFPPLLTAFARQYNVELKGLFDIPFAIRSMLHQMGINVSLLRDDKTKDTYRYLIREVLMEGNTCASLAGKAFHEFAKETYKAQI